MSPIRLTSPNNGNIDIHVGDLALLGRHTCCFSAGFETCYRRLRKSEAQVIFVRTSTSTYA
jgi:hypothetical protein